MDTIKITKDHVKMIAHRGVSGLAMENTVASFTLASEKTYFGIETDIHATKDNKIIVCHDDNIKRVTGVDKVIEESSFAELRKILVMNKEGGYAPETYLPTLNEYIEICKSGNKYAVLEFKNLMTEDNIVQVLDIIRELNYLENMIFISFVKENLK